MRTRALHRPAWDKECMAQGRQDLTCSAGVTAMHSVNSRIYARVVYILLYSMQPAYIKLKETLLSSVICPWVYFLQLPKWMSLFHLTIFPSHFVCLHSRAGVEIRRVGGAAKERMEGLRCGERGLWFHRQLIKLQQASVAQFPLEARKSILQGQFGEKKCDNANGRPPFAFKCKIFFASFNSIKRRRAVSPSASMRIKGGTTEERFA